MISVTILNFHGVGPILRKIDDGERDCWLDPDYFEAVLDMAAGQPHIRLTFDDGNASDVDIALPALLKRGLKAAFFLCAGHVDTPTFLSREQIRRLQANGMNIGSHGVAHVSWRGLASAQLNVEVGGSRKVLEEICGIPVDSAACPFGAYDRNVLSFLRRAGYRSVYTSDGGAANLNHWLKGRNTIRRTMDIADIASLIQNGPGAFRQLSIKARQTVKRLR
jgi:peptidoglycan/xylan/chitin deacetylase (PgdA/CDA1 family)